MRKMVVSACVGLSARVVVAVIAMTTLAGCSGPGEELVAPSSDSTTPEATCFERLDDGGDLEVTDSGFTVLNPDDPDGSYRVSVAVEVTNTSATETMVVADIAVRLLDTEGVKLRGASDEATAFASGRLKFIAPGGSAYFGDVIRTWKSQEPDSVLVEIEPSYWRAESEVTYPEQLVVSDVTVAEVDGEPILEFTVVNSSSDRYNVEGSQIVFRDDQGRLVGGVRVVPWYTELLVVKPGSHEYYYERPLRHNMPPSTDQTSIEVYLDNVPPWEEVEPACAGVFELATAE
ncbi:hypothetical protein FB566_1855 [Stackebrandtia endophytica]|uniref:DUF4352 domain-containing protein n=1 Tax=Stackebrandtia endophytica TaxID=1496996 RepID=A0A543AUR2_9ACTN|nr:hypothetical protein [Stackebrandtia endophytica]TQL76328.1 hypothetical protein FB566_1855 [Stackebrandtia endophytica]